MNRLNCSFKIAESEPDGTFWGYGAAFGNVDSYGDVIAPGAFKDTLAIAEKRGRLPKMLLQHGGRGQSSAEDIPIGVWTKFTEDETGLKAEGKIALNTARGSDIFALMTMTPWPAIDGLSIGYRAVRHTMGKSKGEPYRTLHAVDLVECSIVTNPANDKARIFGTKGDQPTIRDVEQTLRDAGYSAQLAKAICAVGVKAALSDSRDAVQGDDWITGLQKLTASLRAN